MKEINYLTHYISMARAFLLLLLITALPAWAQPALSDDGTLPLPSDSIQADSLFADSLFADSLFADSLQVDSLLPWEDRIREGLERLVGDKMFETSQVGLMVWDLEADSCLYAYRERQLMRPASTMKLLTAITALDRLGGSYLFKTQLKYTGEIADSTLTGDVYVVGGMDPRFNNDDMLAFVNSLKELGIDTIRGNIYTDCSMKDADLLGEGWCWDDNNPVLSPLVFSRKDIFMDRFLSRLSEAGIVYSGFSASEKRCPESAFSLCTRFHTMNQVLHRMMKESDNLYAESMYYQIAASTGKRPATAKDARSVERELVRKIGLDASRYRFADGSGLSLYNYVSAQLLCRLLRYAYQDDNIYELLYSSLPLAGQDGTLKKRMRGATTQGKVAAKTGTLTGCISLAGYLQGGNGHQLCFAIINNGVMHGSNARHFQDKVCTLLCK